MLFLELNNAQDVANFFNISLRHLNYLMYKMPSNKKYRSFTIKTKNKERTILSPCKKLKKIQYQLKKELEIIYKPRSCANGFIKERNNIKNANSHLSKRYIFNLDLQDFFPSITKKRVFFLLKSNGLNFNTEVAEILAKLICHEGVLPQGSPCSPIISNMIAYRMDRELIQLAKMHNATYTRYVDDITFSFTTRFKALPKSILTFKENELTVGEKLTEIIDSNGFTINQSKVRLGKRSNRMEVTGLTVNEKLNVRRKYIKKIRVLFHLIEKHGEEEANRIFATFKRTRGSKYPPQIKQTLYGMLIYLGQVIKTNASLFYKFAMRYNKLNYSKKLPIIKPKEQLAREALWIVDSIDDDAECYQGTAFSISSGLIVTAAHVVINEDKPYEEIEIYKIDSQSKKYKLQVIDFDIISDVAICKIEEPQPHTSFINLSSKADIDSNLILLGFPSFQPAQTSCHIARCNHMFDTIINAKKYFSINTSIIGGNSGGPIINSDYELVGIASKGYYGTGDIKLNTSEDNDSPIKKSQIKGIHVTIMGHNLCSHVNNVYNLINELSK